MLPVPLTPLLGRSRELDESGRLLEAARLLTVTGAGGSGKTRIAIELARRAAERFEEVVWVDLAPQTDPGLIPQQLVAALRLREAPAQEEMQLVLDRLRDRAVLLVFDNCEHVVAAAAVAAETILQGCPNAVILATSREPLGIAGEQTWLVPPLVSPEAVQLFAERARAVAPSFEVDAGNAAGVEEICARLDGIPLAIELAAARVKVLSVGQIAERLADAFRLLSSGSRTVPRHRTIRETIDWSFRLLSADEQALFRRLAVFAGSFSLAAAEAVCGDDLTVLELLSALVDKSLVLRDESAGAARYRLLETVRQFAAAKFEESGEREPFRERHARFFFALVEAAEPRLFAGAGDAAAMATIDAEIGNIRAVFDWLNDPDLELRLVYALHWYWFARGHFHEARRRIAAALARGAGADPLVHARGQVAAGNAAMWQADWGALRPMIDDAVAVLRHGGDLRALSNALVILGVAIALGDGDPIAARSVLDHAVEVARRHGRDIMCALALYWSGLVAQLRGETAEARAAFEEAHRIGVELDHAPGIAHPLTVLGHLALKEGKHGEAIAVLRRAIEVHAMIDDRWGLTQAIEGVGLLLLELDDAEEGTRLLAAASAAWLQLGARPGRHAEFEREKDARIRQAVSDERLRVVLASGAAMPYEQMVAAARAHVERLSASPARGKRAAPGLRVRALGALEIEVDGKPIEGGSQSARARELLLFLLMHPRGATKEQIGAALWPDADPARLRNNFHVTIHRLRKMLGDAEWVVVRGETYALDRDRPVQFDAEVFEREAADALRSKATDAAAHLARAVDLYRGDFFENATSGEWHLEVRDRLRDLDSRALTTLGRALMTAGDFAAAAETYQRLVDLDDLDEQACRNLMTCYGRLGDAAAAARAYRRLSEALRKELDTEPEEVTVRVYEKAVSTA